MGRRFAQATLLAVLSASLASAQNNIPRCGPNQLCPEDTPCCSQYGQCGVGAYCLGGCDPLFSHSLESCVAAPVCRSGDYKLTGLGDMMENTEYLGDSSETNWVYSGNPVEYNGDSVLLTMAPDTVGTLLASTHYMWYGRVSATMTTSQGAGVITAFIMMSDVKDEIDFEFVGVDIETAQSNYYSQGVTDYTNSENLTVSNTVEIEHTYTIDWKPDSITWSIDGEEKRVKNRDETWNSTSNRFDFPQTPSRIMLSLWPAGLPSNGEGTIEWGGGLVDWDSPYMQNGYYFARVKEVKVECYDPPPGANIQGDRSFIYNDYAGTNDTVVMVDQDTTLASFYATGERPDYDPEAARASASASESEETPEPTAEPETVPGMSGAGQRSEESTDTSSSDSSSSSEDGGDQDGGDSSGETSEGEGEGESQQGDEQNFSQNANNENSASKERAVGGSVFAVVVAVLGLLVL